MSLFPFATTEDLTLTDQEVTASSIREYEIDFEKGTLTGRIVTGVDALCVWAYLALKAKRYRWIIYSWGYGDEVYDLIGYSYSEEYLNSEVTPFSVAVVSCVAMRYQITNDINPKVATESPMYYGVGLGRAGTHIITHDIKSTVNKSSDLNIAQALSTGGSSGAITMDIAVKDEVESPHYEGVGVGMAFTKIITHDINSKATNSGNTTVASPVNTATVITIN